MKADLQEIMKREQIDALWIIGSANHNPAMTYFTGNVHVSHAHLIFPLGEEPVLFCNAMEREEAASSGLKTIVTAKYEFKKIVEEEDGNLLKAGARLQSLMFKELGFTSGRVAIYGRDEVGTALGVVKELEKILPDIEFFGESQDSALLEARETKDEFELDRVREMGRITTEVVARTAELLQSSKVDDDEILLNSQGSQLKIGEVKRKINLWLAELGVENPEGTIFAIGRDAGIPHSAGNPEDEIRLGKTIIFDIFPQETGGGYFFDFTRTWCLGYAPEAERKLYEDVKHVYQAVIDELKINVEAPIFQDRTCELFENLGHPTIRQNSQIESGYVHSVGHGLGLDVHERPWFNKRGNAADKLRPGSVVTIEPGLYYPERGMGCRLEDTVCFHEDGSLEIMADFPYDLVLPMQHWQV
jgi:Xaa-Pro aminopeptidase